MSWITSPASAADSRWTFYDAPPSPSVLCLCSYDFFHGAILHPRLFGGRLDIKMFAGACVS